MVTFLLKVFALVFSGADFNFRDGDDVSVYQLLILAVDCLVRRLVASSKDGGVLEVILLLILLFFIFQLKRRVVQAQKQPLSQ